MKNFILILITAVLVGGTFYWLNSQQMKDLRIAKSKRDAAIADATENYEANKEVCDSAFEECLDECPPNTRRAYENYMDCLDDCPGLREASSEDRIRCYDRCWELADKDKVFCYRYCLADYEDCMEPIETAYNNALSEAWRVYNEEVNEITDDATEIINWPFIKRF